VAVLTAVLPAVLEVVFPEPELAAVLQPVTRTANDAAANSRAEPLTRIMASLSCA